MAKDMTKGSEMKLIFLFSLPIMAGNFLQQLYNTADSIIVGQFVSQSALASVGTCSPLTLLFVALALGLSNGGGIIVSQFFGAKKLEDMRKAAATSMIVLMGLGLVLTVVFFLMASFLLKTVLGVPDSAFADAYTYITIYCAGLVFQFAYNIVASILRSLGDSKATLYFLLISSVMNIVLDLVFVIVFHWGVAGAAVATIMSQCASAVVSLVYMFKKYEILRFKRGEFRIDRQMMGLIIRTGIPTTVQQCVVSFGHIAIQRVTNSYGTDLMAAITAAAKVESYVLIPTFGFQVGMSTFSAQNIGAGQVDRVKSGWKKTMVMVAICCAIVVLLIQLYAAPLVRLFGLEGGSVDLGVRYLKVLTPFYVIFGCYMVTLSLLQGAGDVVYAMSCTMSSLIIRSIMTYVLAYCSPLGYTAIWWAQPIGWAVCTTMAAVRYFTGAWKNKSLVK